MFVCDFQFKEGLIAYLEKECKWRHYNLSTQRPPRDVNAYGEEGLFKIKILISVQFVKHFMLFQRNLHK